MNISLNKTIQCLFVIVFITCFTQIAFASDYFEQSTILPNGLIDGQPVVYATTASYSNNIVTITFDGGSGFEWAWLFTPGHNNMTNIEGNIWQAEIPNYEIGETITWSFTVRKNGMEANNVNSPHSWVIEDGDGGGDDPDDPEGVSKSAAFDIAGQSVPFTVSVAHSDNVVTITYESESDYEWIWMFTPQHHNMSYIGDNKWQTQVSNYENGQIISWYFTVRKNGVEANNNTEPFNWIIGSDEISGGPGGGGVPGNGSFPVYFVNNTNGQYSDDEIYIYGLGMNRSLQWCYFLLTGEMVPVNPADADVPGHLTKNGVNYANYAFKLSEAADFRAPTYIRGGRLYISLGSPMHLPIGNNAWGGPDLLNPLDPNADTIYDWYEFTYVHNEVPYGGNTTQVDQFGFPIVATLVQESTGFDETVGITLSRDEVFDQYNSMVDSVFLYLANDYRIVAPRSSTTFKDGGAQADYMQDYIDQVWSHFTVNPFVLERLNIRFEGEIVNNQLVFTMTPGGVEGSGPFHLNKPTTTDVVECAGALASAGMTTTALEMGAEVCAAFNRGTAMNTDNWYDPSAYYYSDTRKNDYSMFFHEIGIDGRAYGFAYDDVNGQSSVKILSNSNPPTSLTLEIGW